MIATQLADEGLDVPLLSRVFLAWPSKAHGRTVQRIGRVMRPHPDKPDALVVDGASDRFGRAALAAFACAKLALLVAAVVAIPAALPFLKGFDSAEATAASEGRRSQELDVDAPATPGSSDDHDHDLDDED